MSRLSARVVTLLVAMVAALFLAGGVAWAATPGPQSPSLTDVQVAGGVLRGVLTVPGADSAAGIDGNSLRVRFGDGTPRQATVTTIAQEQRSALILVDTSGSMAGAKLTAAETAARKFVDLMPSDVSVGLASFAATPHLLVRPTRNHATVLAAIAGLEAGGETSLYDAVDMAVKDLGTNGSRTVVLLSDGGDTTSKASLTVARKALSSTGVHMSAIGFQTDESQYGVLSDLAKSGQGTMIRAGDTASLDKAFASAAQRIAAQVRVMVSVPVGVGGLQHLTVLGSASGKSFSTTSTVSLPAARLAHPAAPDKPTVPAESVAPSGSHLGVWVAAAAVFSGVLIVVLLAASSAFTPEARKRIRTLDSYLGTASKAAHDGAAQAKRLDVTGSLLRVGDAVASRRDSSAATALLLERSDLPLRVGEWYVLRALSVFVGASLGWLMIHSSLLTGLIGVILGLLVGLLVPPLILKSLASRRSSKFESQLPDNLTLIASSLNSGFSLPQAIDAVARDAAEPSAKEFARALAETRIGADLEDALDRLSSRMDSRNLTWTVMAIRTQRHVGGNLANTLRTTAKTLRERESLRRQIRALSADGRLSSYILAALPILVAAYLYLVNRPYLSLLWTKPLGIAMVGGAIVAMIIGIFWMRRTTRVEV